MCRAAQNTKVLLLFFIIILKNFVCKKSKDSFHPRQAREKIFIITIDGGGNGVGVDSVNKKPLLKDKSVSQGSCVRCIQEAGRILVFFLLFEGRAGSGDSGEEEQEEEVVTWWNLAQWKELDFDHPMKEGK